MEPMKPKCICVDFLNGNPDPVPNPDCPIHGPLYKESPPIVVRAPEQAQRMP